MSNTRRLISKSTDISVNTYIGRAGELFYDPTIPELRLSNGVAVGGTVIPTGYINIPQVVASADRICVLSDSGKHILHPSLDTTSRTFTIPASTAVNFDIGTSITIINQNGAGNITIVCNDVMRIAGAGTTGNRTLTANGVCTAIKITETEWIISGTNLT
jgi:hypothetical protein